MKFVINPMEEPRFRRGGVEWSRRKVFEVKKKWLKMIEKKWFPESMRGSDGAKTGVDLLGSQKKNRLKRTFGVATFDHYHNVACCVRCRAPLRPIGPH